MATAIILEEQREAQRNLLNPSIVIAVGVFATTLGQTAVLGRIPLQNLLKNELHVSRAANAAFFFWIFLAWYFKPIAGMLTDAFPLFGSRRKSYMLMSTTLAVLSWAGLYFSPHQYSKLLWVCIVINVFTVIASTVVGAYMVETAQASAGSGRLASIRRFMQMLCFVILGPAAGFLGSVAFGWTAVACGGVTFLLFPAALFFLHEQRNKADSRAMLERAGKQIEKIATAKTMWAAAGLMVLFYIAPGFNTAVFYKQQNELGMDTQAQGFLQMLYGIAGVSAALAYGFLCRRFNLRKLLVGCLLAASMTSLLYLFYSSVGRARVIESCYGIGFTLAELALMDLAVRATPAGSEGVGFSLMMSVRNLGLFGTDWLGSTLMDTYHFHFSSLIFSNCLTTAMAIPMVFLLPRAFVARRDGESSV
jgi:predicted MFS family arabinose efflux permease